MKLGIVAFVVALGAVAGPGSAWAQGLPPGARLVGVDVVGAQRVEKAAVVQATGLRLGAGITLAGLEAAADRVARTGIATAVSFSYGYRGADVTVTFTLVEARLGLPVIFENFPWFTDQDLTRAVAQAVPGFDGRLPETDAAIDRVSEALAERLAAKGVPGRVQYFPYVDAVRGGRAHLFKVDGVALPVCALAFAGVQPALESRVQEACKALVGRELARSSAANFLTATLGPMYRQLGYLRAQVLGTAAAIGSVPACSSGVVLSATVAEGLQYSWKGARWAGNQGLATAELDALLGFKVGDVADGAKLDARLNAVMREYGRRGFLDATTAPVPRFDDAARTVTYELSVSEGAQFRMGALTVVGVPDGAVKKVQRHWALAPGAVFDADYPAKFWPALVSADRELASTLGTPQVKRQRDDAVHVMNVTLTFAAPRR